MNSLLFVSAEQWHELPHFPNPNKWGYAMVSLNNDVYVTGRHMQHSILRRKRRSNDSNFRQNALLCRGT